MCIRKHLSLTFKIYDSYDSSSHEASLTMYVSVFKLGICSNSALSVYRREHHARNRRPRKIERGNGDRRCFRAYT